MKNDLEIHGGEVSRRSEFFFWAFAVLALFLFLGHNALWASEERWAEVAREMLLSGDWLHPSLNWVIYFDKPQLSYWLILPFAVLLGGMDELVVRIPSALAGLAALYGVVSLGKTLFDKRTALLAGWMLLSCYGFLFWSRTAAADAANLAAITVAVAWFYRVEERAKFSALLEAGFIDTYRYFYPDQEGVYSWWSYRFSARAKNAGWRIDYFCVSEALKDRLVSAAIHTEVMGSDHCPVELVLR